MKAALLVIFLALFTIGCARDERVIIVSVSEDERWGMDDGTTVIECPNGRRARAMGKLGKPGETIVLYTEQCR